jgi:diguanylate cyclase (GGDEF)-like protein
MKITGNRPAAAVEGVDAYKSAQRMADEAAPAPPSAAEALSILGIPEAELTPRVRDAIMSLTGEVGRLREDLDRTKARLEAVETMADQDGLLPLLNRRAFVREMSRMISFAERYDVPASLIYFDLDGFKAVNDAHGHAAGDAALTYVADLLAGNVRESDVVGRLGGDEFGVLLAKADQAQAEAKAKSLSDLFQRKPFVWQGQPLALSFTHGAYAFQNGDDADAAMANADKAMYASKRAKSDP